MANNVTVYSYDDAGAPWYPASVLNESSGYLKRYLLIYETLKMCLVDGYPGKLAAGWSMLFDEIALGTGHRYAITNASKSGVLVITSKGTYYAPKVTICDSALDLDTLINDWSFANSATHAKSGLEYQYLTMADSTSYLKPGVSGSYQFTVIATENSAYIHFIKESDRLNGECITSGNFGFYIGAAFYGDQLHGPSGPELGNFICHGGIKSTTSSPSPTTSYAMKTSGTYEPCTYTRTTSGGLVGERDWPNCPPFVQLKGTILSWDRSYYVPMMALTPAIVTQEYSGQSYRLDYVLRLPFYANMFNPGSLNLQKLLIAYFAADFFQPFTHDGVSYMALNRGKGSEEVAPIFPLEPSLWP